MIVSLAPVVTVTRVYGQSQTPQTAPKVHQSSTSELLEIDLRDPHIAGAEDLRKLEDAVRAMAEMALGKAEYSQAEREWAARQKAWWTQEGRWLYARLPATLAGNVVVLGPASKELLDFLADAEARVGAAIERLYGLSHPRYFVVVRFFGLDEPGLPPSVAEIFLRYERASRVAGLTIPPRFVLLPEELPAERWGELAQVFVDRRGRLHNRTELRDVVMHELVHAHVHALMTETARDSGEQVIRDLPGWLDEGLAVYLTEKLAVEPGSKPAAYYRYAAPLHYIEDEFGPEALRDFVRAAVLQGMDEALRIIGEESEDRLLTAARAPRPEGPVTAPSALGEMTERELLKRAEEHARKRAARPEVSGFAWLLMFLGLLLVLALMPAVVAWFWGPVLMRVESVAHRRLAAAWHAAKNYSDGQRRRAAAERFLALLKLAPDRVAEQWAWQRAAMEEVLSAPVIGPEKIPGPRGRWRRPPRQPRE
ncbi:MAG: hypothetical protein N2512_04965 [Armatimonadetes bacterium]|nr:hypothetical protein [Armatimonadota bacterium]